MVSSSSHHVQIFVSYFDKDAGYLERLKVALKPYIKNGKIDDYLWSRQSIKPGANRDEEIIQALGRADAAIFLVNSNYLADDSIAQEEVRPLLTASKQRGIALIPIILGPCAIEESPLYQLEPPHNRNIPLSQAQDADQWWLEVAKKIYQMIIAPLESKYSEQAASNIEADESRDQEVPGERPAHTVRQPEPTPADPATEDQDLYEEYKGKLLGDAEITHLQIPDTSHPLVVSDIYIKVRLHKNPRPRITIEPEATKIQDPLMVMEQRQTVLEQRSNTALDPAFALKQYRRCVIVGDPGAGKTTLLKRLTVQSLQAELLGLPTLPIYVRLNEAARASWDNLLDFVLAGWEKTYGLAKEQMGPFLERKLSNGEALLLLDALDEAVIGNDAAEAEASYKRVVDEIQRLSRRYAVPIVVTARKAGYFQRSQLTGFTELEVLDFMPTEIDQFITRWFRYYGEESRRNIGQRLIDDLKKRPYIATLAANPLLLTLIIITYESNDQQFPENRARLYKDCIDTFLKNWDAKRSIGRFRYFNTNTQSQLLAHIAGHFHEQRRSYFSEEELLAQIREFLESTGESLKQAPQILQEITSENGLLREQAQRVYGFLHLTIQEYFAAASILTVEQLLTHLADPWWEEVILLFAGQTTDAGPLLTHLVGADESEIPEDIFSSKLILAGRCLAAHPRMSKAYAQLRQEIPDRLFDEFSFNEYSLLGEHAAEVLAEIGRTYPEQGVNDRLIAILNDEEADASQKVNIVSALGEYGSRTLGTQLLTMLLEKRFDLEKGIISISFSDKLETALGNLCDDSTLPTFFAILSNEDLRNYANINIPSLIGRIGGMTIIPRLITLLNDTKMALRVRSEIIEALGEYGDASVIPTLISWLEDRELAESCVSALLQLNEPLIGPYLRSHTTISFLKRPYARLLAIVDDPSIWKSLPDALFDEHLDEKVRADIAGILVTYGDEKVRARILSLIGDERIPETIRINILFAFHGLVDSAIIPILQNLGRSEHISTYLKNEISIVLGMLGDHTVLSKLINLLRRDNKELSNHRTFEIVISIAKCAPTSTLISMLTDTSFSSQARLVLIMRMIERKELASPANIRSLLDIVANRKVIYSVRLMIVDLVRRLAYDEGTVERLVSLFSPRSDLKDEIHEALWAVSRRAGVMVVSDGPDGKVSVVRRDEAT